jgi:Beta-eliminating lyase
MLSWPDDASARGAQLAAASFNVTRLPSDAITAELSTDAGQAHRSARSADQRHAPALGDVVRDVFGTDRWLLTGSGRGAESAVASLVRPGQRVLANEVYVSGHWWIERFGGVVDERGELLGSGAGDPLPRHHLDDVAYVQLTVPPAQLGPHAGTPVTLEQLTRVRHWVDRHVPGTPLVLDASRLWENAAATGTDARAAIDLAEILLLSTGKDIGAARGGLVICRDDRRWSDLQEAVSILEGPDGSLTTDEKQAVADGLRAVWQGGMVPRQRQTEILAYELRSLGLPISSWGCGSLFLDARTWLPTVASDELPAQTLLALIYLLTGWRGLGTSTDEPGQTPIVRLVVRDDGSALRHQLPAVADLAGRVRSGLRPLPRDRSAPYLQPAEPVDPLAWPAPPSAQPPATAAWLVGQCHLGYGPQRALADAWSRTAPGAPLHSTNPIIAAIHRRLGGAPDAACSTSMTALTSGAYRQGPPPSGVTAVEVDNPTQWLDTAGQLEAADVVWASTEAGGLLAVRPSSPLAAAIDQASLLTMSTRLTPLS